MKNNLRMYKYFKGENIHCILVLPCEFVYLKLENADFVGGGGKRSIHLEKLYLYTRT